VQNTLPTISQTISVTEMPATSVLLDNGQTFRYVSNEPTSLDSISVIDVAGIYSSKLEDRKAVAEQIREASHNIGFFYMINHVNFRSLSQPLGDVC